MEEELQAILARYDGTLQQAWCRETSYNPEQWTPENPAFGQCAVTAIAVQSLLGGTVKKVKVGRSWHYFNDDIPHVGVVDLTKRQYPNGLNPNTAYWGAVVVNIPQLRRNLGKRLTLYGERIADSFTSTPE